MELKKSYKGIVTWIIWLVAFGLCIAVLPIRSEAIIGRIYINLMTIWITVFMGIIYKTENVYWFSGTSYEEAVAVGKDRRKKFALKHFKQFGLFTGIFLVYSFASYFLGFHYYIDIIVAIVGLFVTSLSTARFHI